MSTDAGTPTGETILAARITETYGLIMLLRREPSRYESKPAFGVGLESGLFRDGLWWQSEKDARTVFAAVHDQHRVPALTSDAHQPCTASPDRTRWRFRVRGLSRPHCARWGTQCSAGFRSEGGPLPTSPSSGRGGTFYNKMRLIWINAGLPKTMGCCRMMFGPAGGPCLKGSGSWSRSNSPQ